MFNNDSKRQAGCLNEAYLLINFTHIFGIILYWNEMSLEQMILFVRILPPKFLRTTITVLEFRLPHIISCIKFSKL